MRIARVTGKLTLSRSHPSFVGASLRIAVPLTFDELVDQQAGEGEWLVVWDELGAGNGSLIAVAEGPEASQAFRPHDKAVDAYNAALIDDISFDAATVRQIRSAAASQKT